MTGKHNGRGKHVGNGEEGETRDTSSREGGAISDRPPGQPSSAHLSSEIPSVPALFFLV